MNKANIRVNLNKCTQCSSCQLQCSFFYFKRFNPAQARIVIESDSIHFTDDCIAKCHLCADYCAYGALIKL